MKPHLASPIGILVAAIGWIACLLMPCPLLGQACEPGETINQCFRRYEGRVANETESEALDAEFYRLAGKLTGTGGVLGSSLASALGDFLPIFAGAPTLTGTDETKLGFEVETNVPLFHHPGAPVQPPNLGGNFQLRVHSRAPEVFSPLLESLPEDQRTGGAETLGSDFDQMDDVTLGVLWNAETLGFGRSFLRQSETFEALLAAAIEEVSPVDKPSLSFVLAPFVSRLDAIIAPERASAPECDADELDDFLFDCFAEPFRSQLGEAIASSATGHRNYRAAIEKGLKDVGFFRLVDLLNNQPQFNLSASYRLRADAVGPDSYSFGARYEHGFGNLNSLRGFCPGGTVTIDCLQRYFAEPEVVSALKNSDRAWAGIEVMFTDDYSFDSVVGDDPVQFQLDGSFSLKGGLGYGRYLRVDETGTERARIDLMVEGEIHQDGSGRNDRFLASLTYTQKVSETFSLPLGITFANKPEFIGEVDREFGVHFGIRYRLQRKAPEG